MLTICEAVNKMTAFLKDSLDDARFEAEIILAHILKKDRIYINAYKDLPLDEDIFNKYENLCQKRQKGMPFAYITNSKEFMGLDFYVDENVLIPRCETEMIVEYVISKYKGLNLHIADLCCGSGIIGISVLHYLKDISVTAIDISDGALEVSKKNADNLNVSKRITFKKGDALKPLNLPKKADILISNPPYIKTSVIDTLSKDVKDYEPHLALDGSYDGLIFYREIVNNIESALNKDGEIIFEIGYDQAKDVCDILKDKFKDVKVYKDIFQNDRMVTGILKG